MHPRLPPDKDSRSLPRKKEHVAVGAAEEVSPVKSIRGRMLKVNRGHRLGHTSMATFAAKHDRLSTYKDARVLDYRAHI